MMKVFHFINRMIPIVFVAFVILIMNECWHYFEPCNQKYTIILDDNVDIASAVDSVLSSNEVSMKLWKDGICFSFSVEKIKDRKYIYALDYVRGLGESGDLSRGRSIFEIMRIEARFEKTVLSKLGKWRKHHLQGLSSFLADKSWDFNIFLIFGCYVLFVPIYLIIYLIIRKLINPTKLK